MDLHDLMSSLQQASDLDLLRLRTAIDHLLYSPTRILAVRQHLHVGQEVHFWNLRDNRMQHGRITKFKSDQLLIPAENPPQYWWVPYAALQPDPSQAPLPLPLRPLDLRRRHPPVLGRILSRYQELIGLVLGDAAML